MTSLSQVKCRSKKLYFDLPLTFPHHTRLLRLLPGSCDDGLPGVELRAVDLAENPKYVALSYTWGPSTDEEAKGGVSGIRNRLIQCHNDSSLPVTENLYRFLCQAAHAQTQACLSSAAIASATEEWMWIDAICINQEDAQERTNQVKLMADIFTKANSVLVWLGDEDPDTEPSFGLMKALAKCSPEKLKRSITPQNLGSEEMHAILGAHGHTSCWHALVRLFHRRYFTRVWIVQEISLARHAVVVCGRHRIAWEDVANVSELLTLSPWTRWMMEVTYGGGMLSFPSRVPNHSIPTFMRSNRRTKFERAEPDLLLHVLIRSRGLEATDVRDKVYGLLGIAGASSIAKVRLSPVYENRSVAETYILAAIQILEDSDNLLLLAHAEGECFRVMPWLPSWVPDWSCRRTTGIGITGYKRFSAAGNLPRSLSIDEKTLTICVRGVRLDAIKTAGCSKRQIVDENMLPQWLEILASMAPVYHRTGQPRCEVFWRTLITDTIGPGRPHTRPASPNYRTAFFEWVKRKIILAATNGTAAPSPQVLDRLDELAATDTSGSIPSSADIFSSFRRANMSNFEDEEENSKIYRGQFEATFSYAPNLRLFSTEQQGLLGLGSESLKRGDSVWVVVGSRVPLILRECAGNVNRFQIVGGAYLHGFMDGEALQAGYTLTDIVIE